MCFDYGRLKLLLTLNLASALFHCGRLKLLLTLNLASAIFLVHYATKPVDRNDGGDRADRPLSPPVPPGLRVRVACPLGIGRNPA
ncbi:MAG: hypothetical protein KME57_16050 [Scytonema hyalinum WJT4-NPBG1]|nr:hypothetical protein [Scytonema hyalinum WJT4-NPBG1]